jgi:hypothetical protein
MACQPSDSFGSGSDESSHPHIDRGIDTGWRHCASPACSTPGLAIAAVGISLFGTTCLSVNYYALPLDLFGSVSAGFAISLLTGVFGLCLQFSIL